METPAVVEMDGVIAQAERRPRGRFAYLRRARGLPLFSGFVLGLFFLAGTVGPFVAPHDPIRVNLGESLLPPVWAAGGVASHPLGTDLLGRDVLSRLLGGARVSLLVAFAVVILSGSIGVLIALVSGYLAGKTDAILMRVTDAVMAFPFLLLAIVIVGVFGASLNNVIVLLALSGWAGYARVLRSEVLSLKTQEFVTMAKVMGANPTWIMWRHLLPNVASTFLVLATLQLGGAIVAEGSLSFLGIGVPPPAPSWGGMLADGRRYLTTGWWLPTMPGLALSLTVLSTNMMGDWLRMRNDPTGRR